MATREDFCSYEALESHCTALSALSGVTTGDLVEAITNASELMWALTGRQFGAYTETVRPDLRGESASWFDLRRFPVTGISEVKIDGATVPSSAYWVRDGRHLVRTDETPWPQTQKLYLDDTEDETFSVTLTWGAGPPAAVAAATRRLACELLSLKFGGHSGLPDRVRSTVRQGISMEHVSAEDLLQNGRTGIYEIDFALETFNRDDNAALPAVMSPDIGWNDHDGTTTVGAEAGISTEWILSAISTATSGLSSLTDEQVRDLIAGFIAAGTGVTVAHDDSGDTLTISADGVAALADLTDVDTTTDPADVNDVLAWDGTNWTPATLTADSSADYTPADEADWADPAPETFSDALDALAAAAGGGGASLSDSTPADLGTAAAGVATDASRSDHVHDMPTAADIAVDASGFNGNLTTSDDTVQEVAQKLDDLTIPAAGIADPGGANDDFLQRKAGAWTNRTVAQVKTDLGITDRPPPTAKVVGYYAPSGITAGNMTSPLTAAGVMAAAPVFLWAGDYTQVGNAYYYGTGTATVRLGLYDSTGTGGYPGALVSGADFGTISCVNGAAGAKSITISFTLAASGWYWIAALCDAYTGTPDFVGYPTANGFGPMKMAGFPTAGDSNGASCVTKTGVSTGSMPSTFGTPTSYTGIRFPVIRLYLNS